MLGERGNAPRRTDTFALFFLSLLYFAVGCLSHLEPIDEGQLVYPSWRVAEGAIPFRDFMHLYGPSPFFLNGALFRWFGHDLLVLRLSLAVLKAGAAVVVFLSASHLMSRSFAWLVSGLFVAVWGFPWAFNSPYPNHYAMTAVLAGMLVFLCLPRRFLLGCFLAGLSFGLAATFKQTTGAFAAVWFALFLLVERPPVPPEEGHWNVGGGAAALASRLVRWAVVAGALSFVVGCQVGRTTFVNMALVSAPLLAAILFLGWREWRQDVAAWRRVRSACGVFVCAAGVAVPLLAYGVAYARLGLLSELLFNVWNVPLLIDWFVPFLRPNLRVLICVGAAVAPFVAVWLWRRGDDRRPLRWAAVAVALSFLVLLWLVGSGLTMPHGWLAMLRTGAWYGDVFRLIFYLPLGTVLVGVPLVFSAWKREGEPRRSNALLLYWFAAAGSMLFFHPGGDFWHVIMALPPFLLLLGHELERFHRANQRGSLRLRTGSVAVVGAFSIVLAAPFVHGTVRAVVTRPPSEMRLERATGVVGFPPHFEEVVELVSYLRARPGHRGLLVITDEQLIYFLAGEPSVVEKSEFILYLVGAGIIRQDDVRKLVPEAELLERLRETRPWIVDAAGSRPAALFRQAFPDVARFIDASYRLQRSIGTYRVLVSGES